jgi:hypothetical protein
MTLTLAPFTPVDDDEAWPKFLDTEAATLYLRKVVGFLVEKKTLANYRAIGKGPRWKYFGQKPIVERSELDRWVNEEALKDESPLTRRARERKRSVEVETTSAPKVDRTSRSRSRDAPVSVTEVPA